MKRKAVSLLLAGVMILGTSVTAMAQPAATEKDLDGQGYIAKENEYTENDEDDDDQSGMIDVTVPANGFLWYANEDTAVDSNGVTRDDDQNSFDENDITEYEIRSGEYSIINNSSMLDLQVTLKDYKVSGRNYIEQLGTPITLKLTGDLAAPDGATDDLLGSFSTTRPADGILYSELLSHDSIWVYGFTGTYHDNILPSASTISDYVLILELEATGYKVDGE